jgi:hypothetical protein
MFTNVLQSFGFKVNFGTPAMISQIWWIEPNVLLHHKENSTLRAKMKALELCSVSFETRSLTLRKI